MDFQHRPGGKTGSGGVASSSESNRDRRERLRQLALETIDINKVHVPSHHLCPPCTRELHLEWQLSVSTRGRLLFVAPRLKGLLPQEAILSQRCGESPVVGALMAPRAAKAAYLYRAVGRQASASALGIRMWVPLGAVGCAQHPCPAPVPDARSSPVTVATDVPICRSASLGGRNHLR